MTANYTVYQNDDGMWVAKRNEAERAASVHDTQADAWEAAKEYIMNSGGGELTIMGMDGEIREKNTYGKKDPYPPQG